MKAIWLVAGSAIILGSAGAVWHHKHAEAAALAAAPTGVKVERGPIRQVVSSTGKIVSNLDVDIKCQAGGQVIKVPFDISQHVRQGDVLIQIDPIDEQHVLEQAQASLDSAAAKLDQAKQNEIIARHDLITAREKAEAGLAMAVARAKDSQAKAERMQQLLHDKLASQEDYETAQTTADTSKADVNNATAAVDDLKSQELSLYLRKKDVALAEATVATGKITVAVAEKQLSYTTVTAPMDGVVSARTIQVGNVYPSAITNVSGGTAAMTISDLSHIFVLATVDESDIGALLERFHDGKGAPIAVEVTADAYAGKHFEGKVVRIATTGVNNSNVITFEVKIEVTSDNKGLLRPQMTANVDIIVSDQKDVLLAPVTAITHRKNKAYVDVIKADGTREEREVIQGVSDINKTEIKSGLSEGETVDAGKNILDSKWKGTATGGGGPGGHGP